MQRIIGHLIIILLTVFSFEAFSVCLTQDDADFDGCIKLEDRSADKWCQKQYGNDFKAFYTTNTCSKELAYSYRNKSYKATKEDLNGVVEASCLTYEDGVKNNCTRYDYELATRYCTSNYGSKFIAFIPNQQCSLSKSSKLRGEVDSKVLISDLASRTEEVEAIMTMLDRNGINSSLGGSFLDKETKVTNEFYTNTVLTLIANMKMLKKQIYENGQKNVSITGKYVPEYLKYSFRYLNLVSRIYKLYAYVAHRNQYVLKTYTFDHFQELNLKLKKKYALEILARVNFKVLTVDEGESLEFTIGEQDKQTLEYMAVEKPKNKTEYAKLIQFLGVRETLTNFWAVQRLTATNIPNSPVNSCGKGFLSFRPDSSGKMQNSEAMNDLWSYDVFYNDYTTYWNQLVDATNEVSILDANTASELNYYVMTKVKELNSYMKNEMYNSLSSDAEFKQRASEDADMRVFAESYAWENFSNDHFSTIVMPGDGVLNKKNIAKRIYEDAFRIRVDAIVDNFQGSYPYISKAGLKHVKEYIVEYMNLVHAKNFKSRIENKVISVLSNYNNKNTLRNKNKAAKVNETLEVVKKSAQAAYIEKELSNKKPNLEGVLLLDPENVEELMMLFERKLSYNFDIRAALEKNKEMADVLNKMFTKVADAFGKKYIKEVNGEMKYTGSAIERAKGLREIVYSVGREFYKQYPFDILKKKLREIDESLYTVARDNTRVDTRKYMPVYKDGTPALMSKKEVSKSLTFPKFDKNQFLKEQYTVARDNTRVHINPLFTGDFNKPKLDLKKKTSGYNKDKVTTGEIATPTYITQSGSIMSPKGVVGQVNNELLQLVKRSGVLNRKSVEKLEAKSESMISYKKITDFNPGKEITTVNNFLFRVFEVLNISNIAHSITFNKDYFAHANADQEVLAQNKTTQAYQMAPILRNDYTWTQTETVYRTSIKTDRLYKEEVKKTYTLPLLIKIAKTAYNPKTGTLNTNEAKRLIEKSIEDSINNSGTKLSTFCNANFLNYKNDANFRNIFLASKFLRATVKNPMGQDENFAKMMESFDEGIAKDVRTKSERINEDYFEPALKFLGTAAIIALGVVLIIGSGGTAAPGVIGGIYGAASMFLAAEFFISFPLVVGSLYSRINTNFVEMPAQLKFQRSLAQSQVDFSQVVDWDMLKADEKALKNKQAWTIGLMPLDFIYGASLIKHVRTEVGVVGRNAYRRLTGTKLRGWGAPPPSMMVNTRFKDLRKTMGIPKALMAKSKEVLQRASAYMPKYQALPEHLLHGSALRVGLAKKAKELGIHGKPWELVEEIKKYESTLRSRLTVYDDFVKTEAKILGKVRLNGKLATKEVMEHGLKYSSLSFIPKSYWKAMKEGNLLKYLKNNDELWTELKHIQGEMVNKRAKDISKTIDKMEDFKKSIQSGAIAKEGEDLMGQMLKNFSNEEILVLQEISKRSKGTMGQFNSIFKDYRKVVSGLRPMGYLYGQSGVSFAANSAYPQNIILGDKVSNTYAFKTDAEDLVNYYESMIKQNGNITESANQMRQTLEDKISHYMTVDSNGNRSFHN